MGTRQTRISDPLQIHEQIRAFAGKKINIVLTDNTAMVGVLVQVKDTEITLQNMRLKNITYPLNTIAELYFDKLD